MAAASASPSLWWLASRAAGVVALALVSVSVILGLLVATKLLRRSGAARVVVRVHEHVALAALAAICAHGLTLLGDPWLRPGLRGIALPFAMSYRPLFTGLGVVGGYLAAILGPSFYLRRRIGARRWRALHRAIAAVWLLSVVHTLGAGTDAATPWLRGIVLLSFLPIVFLITLRLLQPHKRSAKRPATHPGTRAAGPAAARHGHAAHVRASGSALVERAL